MDLRNAKLEKKKNSQRYLIKSAVKALLAGALGGIKAFDMVMILR